MPPFDQKIAARRIIFTENFALLNLLKALAGTMQADSDRAQSGADDGASQNIPSPPSESARKETASDGLNMTQSLLLRHEQVAQRARRHAPSAPKK